MSDDLKNKFVRTMRANLNDLLDRIKEFEEGRADAPAGPTQGGFEQIGTQGPSYVPPKSATEKTLRDYYANLECEYGADMDTVKESYRRLMRMYHPDKYTHDPRMEELSTELTQELTRAYQSIEAYWKTGKY